MKKNQFSLHYKDDSLKDLVSSTDRRILAAWAIDCVKRVMPFFDEKYPEDHRLQRSLENFQQWIITGVFRMPEIRKAALAAHAVAREIGKDEPAGSVARAVGQAVATAHVKTHAVGAVNYILQAVYRSSSPEEAEFLTAKEREWQYNHLLELQKMNC